MKKFKTIAVTLFSAVILSGILSGCFFFGDTGIVGSWNLVRITNDGIIKTAEELGYVQVFTFYDDGSFKRTKDGVVTGEGTFTYLLDNGYLQFTPASAWVNDTTLGPGTSSVIDNVFDRGYHDPVTDSDVSELYSRIF